MHKDDRHNEETVLSKFALMIKDMEYPDGHAETRIMSDGDMASAKVLLIVEGWVEKQKAQVQRSFSRQFCPASERGMNINNTVTYL
jgi:hypothetical protein